MVWVSELRTETNEITHYIARFWVLEVKMGFKKTTYHFAW
jgi:hypothetical protein